MNLEANIRKIARSYYWLKLYNSSKEISSIQLFLNTNNFSGIQVLFLYWLQIYSMIWKELSESEWENLDEEVINNDIRLDAFLHWRSKQIQHQISEYKRELKKSSKKGKGKGETLPIWTGKNNE